MSQSTNLSNASQSATSKVDRAFTLLSAGAVVLALITGFWMQGSPGRQRLISLDKERVEDLSNIANELSLRTNGTGGTQAEPLPDSLPESLIYTDPSTNEPYEYRRLSDTDYELCATFSTDSSDRQGNSDYLVKNWPHPAGAHCFSLKSSQPSPN